VDIQFGDGPLMTLVDLDGSIQPREEAGIGPEMAAIASSLNVYETSPSDADEHVNQVSETVSSGFRNQGVSYLLETVPQMYGIDSSRLAQDKPTFKKGQAFRKRKQKRTGLDQPIHSQLKWGEAFWKEARKNAPKEGEIFVQRQK
jgi:hypothetical protein